MKAKTLIGGLLVAFCCAPAHASILTFDVAGISNGLNVNQGYGDAVIATTMGSFSYGVGAEGFTPNVQAAYGSNDPSLWKTGYGDLTNILFENQDSSGILTLTLTADAGYQAVLYGFDLAAFSNSFSGDPIVQSITVKDGSNTLFSLLNGTVSETTHTSFDFSATPLVAGSLTITVDARNLGSLNDDIGMDNVRFGQQQQPVPEPATLTILGLGALGFFRRKRL